MPDMDEYGVGYRDTVAIPPELPAEPETGPEVGEEIGEAPEDSPPGIPLEDPGPVNPFNSPEVD